MIPYCVYFGLFIALVFYNEEYFSHSESLKDGSIEFEGEEYNVMLGLTITLLAVIAYFFFLLFKTCQSLGKIFWKFIWVWLNLTSNCLNLTVVVMTMLSNKKDDSYTQDIRRIEAVAVILMWLRFLYFFPFIFIFVLIILGFANGFYVLAKNQLATRSVDETEEEAEDIPYMTYG
jgi:hypothetical protein